MNTAKPLPVKRSMKANIKMEPARYKEAEEIKELVNKARKILIIQPDNPDGDSLGSSLALEEILGNLGKDVVMVCGMEIPVYLSYLAGWDRVIYDPPTHFDLSIVVDTSSLSLLENLTKQVKISALRSKPMIVVDHHSSPETIDFATIMLKEEAASTTQVIYELSKQLSWDIPQAAKIALTAGILSDTLGLTSSSTTARTVFILAELVSSGVSLSALENARRDFQRKSPELVHYKGQLLERIEYFNDNRLALLTIPWPEIERYSPQYNPSVLALEDMRLTTGTIVAVALKIYPDGKVTGKIRCNYGYPIAAKLAEAFGGGGHDYASGFKLQNNPNLEDLKNKLIVKSRELCDEVI